MRKTFKIAALFALLAACVSCSDSFENNRLIRFSASSGNPATKASYSDQKVDGKERIDWNVNDYVFIICPESPIPTAHASYYLVKNPVADGFYSNASLELYSTEGTISGLQWAEDDIDHHFFAISPTSMTNSSIRTRIIDNTPTAAYWASIPGSQAPVNIAADDSDNYTAAPDMNNLLMVATATYPKNSTVQLDFKPVVTAVEFTIMNGYEDQSAMELSSIKFSSSSSFLSGSYESRFGSSSTTYQSATKAVEIPFSTPVSVAYGKTLKFTVFMLGDESPNAAAIDDVTIELVTDTDTSIKTLLKTSAGNMTFPRSKKSYVTGLIIPGKCVWTISAEPDTVTAWDLVDNITVDVTDPTWGPVTEDPIAPPYV